MYQYIYIHTTIFSTEIQQKTCLLGKTEHSTSSRFFYQPFKKKKNPVIFQWHSCFNPEQIIMWHCQNDRLTTITLNFIFCYHNFLHFLFKCYSWVHVYKQMRNLLSLIHSTLMYSALTFYINRLKSKRLE